MHTETNTSTMKTVLLKGLFGDLKKSWGWMLMVGILFTLLGVMGLYMTVALTMASVLFFGMLLLAGGIIQLIDAFKCKGWKSITLYSLIAVLYIVAGIAIMLNPAGASVFLTAVLAWLLITIGLLRMVMAFQLRATKGWSWSLIGGIASIGLGAIILAKWPVSGLWIIGLFIALEMIIQGWSLILIGWAARTANKLEHQKPPTGAAPA